MLRKDIEEKFPFLSVVTYGGSEYIGIINNQDAFITSMYIYTDLRSDDDKAKFVELGEVWWWESNRMIPINIFLQKDMEYFKYIMIPPWSNPAIGRPRWRSTRADDDPGGHELGPSCGSHGPK